MKKRIAAIIAIITVLAAAITVSAASTNSLSADSVNSFNDTRWETTSIGANW